MQIHELPAGSPASGVQFAGDTGTQTQKIDYDALADAIIAKMLSGKVANNLVTTAAGLVLDARQGKALDDKIASLNSSIQWKKAGTAQNTNPVSYPADAKELLIAVYKEDGGALLANAIYVVGQFSTYGILMISGYYYTGSDYGIVNVNISETARIVSIRNFIYGGRSYADKCSLTVRYK